MNADARSVLVVKLNLQAIQAGIDRINLPWWRLCKRRELKAREKAFDEAAEYFKIWFDQRYPDHAYNALSNFGEVDPEEKY